MSETITNTEQLLHDLVYLAAVLTTLVNVLIWMANKKLDE